MILDELVLHNVGVFSGRHHIALTPPSASKPVILIGGLNGGGKTTILEAIQLALYGSLARIAARRSASYDTYLRQSIHSGANPKDGASVELSFHAHDEGIRHSYRIRRSWRSTGSGLREDLDVNLDGKFDATLTEQWLDHVESFVPRGVAPLFFFDGEQIEAFADLDNSRNLLGTAIGALLGLDLADRLTADLTVLERRHRIGSAPAVDRSNIEDRQNVVVKLRLTEERLNDAVAEARVATERAEKAVFEADERYRLDGGELFEQRAILEDRLVQRQQAFRLIEIELRESAAGAAPLLLLLPQLESVVERSEIELRAGLERALAEVLSERDSTVLDVLKEAKASRTAIASVERLFTSDREERLASSSVEDVVDLNIDEAGFAATLARLVLPDVIGQVRALLMSRESALSSMVQAERSLAAIPAEDAVAKVAEQRLVAQRDLALAQSKLAETENQLASARSERIRADRIYEETIDTAARATLAAEDEYRLIEHAQRVRATLDKFRVEATRRHVGHIESLVLNAFGRLIRKNTLITELHIDPESYAVQLLGSAGDVIAPGQLSAGERQLLAVSLLWGLAQASNKPMPVVIDTPLGRLDGSHRQHLVDRYFPQASHQVILLSTDKEIDEEAWNRLRPRVGRAFRLDFDDSTASTSVHNGYFW